MSSKLEITFIIVDIQNSNKLPLFYQLNRELMLFYQTVQNTILFKYKWFKIIEILEIYWMLYENSLPNMVEIVLHLLYILYKIHQNPTTMIFKIKPYHILNNCVRKKSCESSVLCNLWIVFWYILLMITCMICSLVLICCNVSVICVLACFVSLFELFIMYKVRIRIEFIILEL